MSKLVQQSTDALKQAIQTAMQKAIENEKFPAVETLPEFTLEVPAERSHGDWACNVAMVSARTFKLAPRAIAEIIIENLDLKDTFFERCEIAGPGFINFFFTPQFYIEVLKDIETMGVSYGSSDFGKGEKVMIEFVSANPTGPMHMGNARGGALGDCLGAVMDVAGFKVWREFYVNDAGNQIKKFASSLEARYLQIYKGEEAVPFPEDGYQGEDIKESAKVFSQIHGDKFVEAESDTRKKALVDLTLPSNVEKLKTDLEKYRIVYDEWFPESTLHESGEVDAAIEILKEKGMTYEKDEALWFKASEFEGIEKDEVLLRANGLPTYFAVDIAYHRNKFSKRGYERCINVWGADHHGHIARLKAAMDAIGLDGSKLDIITIQLVRLMQGGEIVRMSKRTGKAIQLSDLLDEVPVDAARFIFNMREATSQMDFDLDLAVQKGAENPVYYVQYANARICSLSKKLEQEGFQIRSATKEDLALLVAEEEIELISHLASYTNEIVEAAKYYDPARITRYAITLATLYHKFYNNCRVYNPEHEALTTARFALCKAISTVLCNILSMFKISAPESM